MNIVHTTMISGCILLGSLFISAGSMLENHYQWELMGSPQTWIRFNKFTGNPDMSCLIHGREIPDNTTFEDLPEHEAFMLNAFCHDIKTILRINEKKSPEDIKNTRQPFETGEEYISRLLQPEKK